MNSKFYFGSMPPSGVANIFIEMFVKQNQIQQFVDPCPLEIRSFNGESYSVYTGITPYAKSIEDKFQIGFRSVDWANNIDYLIDILANNQPLSMWFATFYPDTFYAVKNHFKTEVTTIAINYTTSDYEFVLDKWVNYQAGLIVSRPAFADIKIKFNSLSQIKSYCRQVGSEQFGYSIPKEKQVVGDINVSVTDLFSRNTLEPILTKLNCSCSDDAWNFYSNYIKIC